MNFDWANAYAELAKQNDMLTKLSATLADAKALLAKENAELVERVSQLSPLCKCPCNLDENLTHVHEERATAVLASSLCSPTRLRVHTENIHMHTWHRTKLPKAGTDSWHTHAQACQNTLRQHILRRRMSNTETCFNFLVRTADHRSCIRICRAN
jgi:hypothetical protein